jgi:hypothetical protein
MERLLRDASLGIDGHEFGRTVRECRSSEQVQRGVPADEEEPGDTCRRNDPDDQPGPDDERNAVLTPPSGRFADPPVPDRASDSPEQGRCRSEDPGESQDPHRGVERHPDDQCDRWPRDHRMETSREEQSTRDEEQHEHGRLSGDDSEQRRFLTREDRCETSGSFHESQRHSADTLRLFLRQEARIDEMGCPPFPEDHERRDLPRCGP